MKSILQTRNIFHNLQPPSRQRYLQIQCLTLENPKLDKTDIRQKLKKVEKIQEK